MHLPTIRKGHPVEVKVKHDPTPRDQAVRWLQQEITEGRAGLDPYDSTILILEPREHEHVWTRAVVLICGKEMSRYAGSYRMVVDADVREVLGLDRADAPLMEGVALASRAYDSASLPSEVTIASLDRPELMLVDAGPESA